MKYKVQVKLEALVTYEVSAKNPSAAIEAAKENLEWDFYEHEFITDKVRPASTDIISAEVLD